MTERLTVNRALQAVRESDDGLYGVLLENGSMELGYYKPTGIDEQSRKAAAIRSFIGW